MIADGAAGFIAWSVYVNPAFEDLRLKRVGQLDGFHPVAFQEEKTELAVDAAAVPPTNLYRVNTLIRRYAQRRDETRYVEPNEEEIPTSASEEGNDLIPKPELAENENALRNPGEVERSATSVRHHEIYLQTRWHAAWSNSPTAQRIRSAAECATSQRVLCSR